MGKFQLHSRTKRRFAKLWKLLALFSSMTMEAAKAYDFASRRENRAKDLPIALGNVGGGACENQFRPLAWDSWPAMKLMQLALQPKTGLLVFVQSPILRATTVSIFANLPTVSALTST